MAERDFPNNSHRNRTCGKRIKDNTEKKEIKPVAKGRVKKKSEIGKFMDIFRPDDVDIKEYIINEKIIPFVKNTTLSVVNMILYGEDEVDRRKKGSSKVSYRDYYDRERDRRDRYREDYRRDSRFGLDEIVFDTRADAEEILETLEEAIDVYGSVSVADLYDAANMGNEVKNTHSNYGWENLSTAKAVRSRDGWTLRLPKVIPLD